MANGFAVKLRVNLKPSGYLLKFIGCSYLFVVIVCLFTPVDWLIRLAVAFTLIVYVSYLMITLTGKDRVHCIEFSNTRGWQLKKSEIVYPVTLLFPFYITHWLVVLSFSLPNGRKEKIVLLPDSADGTEFRHLRVRLLQLADAYSKNDKKN